MKMNNNSKFTEKKIINLIKFIFHITNILLLVFYLYPGSIFGCFIYNDCGIQPQLTGDFVSNMISSNHVYVFIIISFLGFIGYLKKTTFKYIVTYLLFISVFLELMHIVIPERGFEIKDLTGNIVGVVISFVVFIIYKKRKKSGFI